jgi:tRNA 2-selenouridine synthase SelU
MKEIFDVDYFINKFSAIPERKIITRFLNDKNGNHCAEGWCRFWGGNHEDCLNILLNSIGINWASEINNSKIGKYQQPTPKQRILAALQDIKERQIQEANVKAAEEIVNTEVYENQS